MLNTKRVRMRRNQKGNEIDMEDKIRQILINNGMNEAEALNESTQEILSLLGVRERLPLMITQLENKIENTEYDSVFNRDCDIDDLRCLKRTLEIFTESNLH